ncbi:GNAT family N-acetyltransferase [Aquimarina longa]|uniref:GNAT family N-acetyltransferase n=1 Tax=Aquimarina longa TaxID=1080221 RepID=UPI000781B557|nr:GNAT family N-acetyltransferase [Aquimarina longa]
MKSIIYTRASFSKELQQILTLQYNNLPVSISKTEKEREGFVSVQHDLTTLTKMNDQQPHIIAKDEDNVIGYALCMTQEFKNEIDILKPMFLKIDTQLETNVSYVIMGQICVDKAYRKQGVFRGLYYKMRIELHEKYDVLITEVAANNLRSLQAHHAIGFKTWITYEVNNIKWHIIRWDWNTVNKPSYKV